MNCRGRKEKVATGSVNNMYEVRKCTEDYLLCFQASNNYMCIMEKCSWLMLNNYAL